MAKTAWQQRIQRAKLLSAQHPFAVEILAFYLQVARFQEAFYERSSAGVSPAVKWTSQPLLGQEDAEATTSALLASFPQFLKLVEQHGPDGLARVAVELLNATAKAWTDLLNQVWSTAESPSTPQEFLAFTFLQPYAELFRRDSAVQLEGYTHPLCPICSRKPALGILRPLGDGAQRRLQCGFCLAEWEFRRVLCPACGEESHAKLPVYTSETFPHIRVECCDSCRTYIKSIDLTKNGLAEPLVDELASIPLDLWAQEHEYGKLCPNLFGM